MKLNELKLTPRRQKLLEEMGIDSVENLLRTYPLRYEKIEVRPFSEWKPKDQIAVEGMISSRASVIRLPGNRSMTRFHIICWDQELQVTLFNRPWPGQFPIGKNITLFGIYDGNNRMTANNYNMHPLLEQQGLKPVYSVNAQMKQSDMKACMEKALKKTEELIDVIPERLRLKYRLVSLDQAMHMIHQPQSEEELHQAIRALKYEEFLRFQVTVLYAASPVLHRKPILFDEGQVWQKTKELPYALTEGQSQALQDVIQDLKSPNAMYRLVQGDVGCGKTVVAAMALYAASLQGVQAALLAPTEILAVQHQKSLDSMGIEAQLYTSSLSVKEKKRILNGLKDGSIQTVTGTHALFQDAVEFHNLHLVIADEQQRFGVRQRRSLLEKGIQTDFLMMSATPIPRTSAHFLYGDIALSSIRTLPPGRKPVETVYVPSTSMKKILPEVEAGLDAGRQLYVVCPAIEDNPDAPMRSAVSVYEGMQKILGNRYSIGLLHGRMKQEEKDQIMEKFKNKEFQILVSTTVIEVGIDVADATMMVIYDAHRFGLSTLHQLRGRCARGKVQGKCWLLSASKDLQAKERLLKMETMLDGFSVSKYDLAMRGPGDLLGTRQSGIPAFVLGDLYNDEKMMDAAYQDAKEIIERHEDFAILHYAAKASRDASYMD